MYVKDFLQKQLDIDLVAKYVKQYINPQTFINENMKFLNKYGPSLTNEKNVWDLKREIIDYKLKIATKNKSKLNNDPRTYPFVDITDTLRQYVKDVDTSKGYVQYITNKDSLITRCIYNGKICLPFKHCFVYINYSQDSKCILDIKDNEDGTYAGTLYTYWNVEQLVQVKFNIYRNENDWCIEINFIPKQKPLGQELTNISTLLLGLQNIDKQYAKESDLMEQDPLYVSNVQLAFSVRILLYILSCYETSNLYKVNKDGTDIFVYTNGNTDYLEETYQQCSYELQDNWIVDGYWKFLPQGQLGKDKHGKSIKGLTWVVPYNTDSQTIEHKGYKSNSVKIHAIQRARERYNIDLTPVDLQNIVNECLAGRCHKLMVKDKFGIIRDTITLGTKDGCYRINYKDTIIDFVLKKKKINKQYRVATLLPKPKDTKTLCINSKDYATIKGEI